MTAALHKNGQSPNATFCKRWNRELEPRVAANHPRNHIRSGSDSDSGSDSRE
jgi:hypothetical protein